MKYLPSVVQGYCYKVSLQIWKFKKCNLYSIKFTPAAYSG